MKNKSLLSRLTSTRTQTAGSTAQNCLQTKPLCYPASQRMNAARRTLRETKKKRHLMGFYYRIPLSKSHHLTFRRIPAWHLAHPCLQTNSPCNPASHKTNAVRRTVRETQSPGHVTRHHKCPPRSTPHKKNKKARCIIHFAIRAWPPANPALRKVNVARSTSRGTHTQRLLKRYTNRLPYPTANHQKNKCKILKYIATR